MTVALSPLYNASQQFDAQGNPLAGARLHTYVSGTTTPLATFTSSSGGTANANPIVFDSSGYVPGEIWLTVGQEYTLFLTDADGDPVPGHTTNNVIGISTGGGGGGTLSIDGYEALSFDSDLVPFHLETDTLLFDQGLTLTEDGETGYPKVVGPQTAVFMLNSGSLYSTNQLNTHFGWSEVKPAPEIAIPSGYGLLIKKNGWYRITITVDYTACDFYGNPTTWFNNVCILGTTISGLPTLLPSSTSHSTGHADSSQNLFPSFMFNDFESFTRRTFTDTYLCYPSDIEEGSEPTLLFQHYVSVYSGSSSLYSTKVVMVLERLTGAVPPVLV